MFKKRLFNHNLILLLFHLFLCVLCSNVAWAELTYKRNNNQFAYTWIDSDNNQQQLSFSVNKNLLFNSFRTFKAYRPQLANQFLYIELQKAVVKLESKQTKIKLTKLHNSIKIELQSSANNAKEIQQKIIKIRSDLIQEYLNKHYYMKFKDSFATPLIKPDHIRIASESIALFDGVAEHASKSFLKTPPREIINFYLSWLQSIPYADLEDRITAQGSGFNPPNRLLLEHQGDCDSKSTLYAALIRRLFSRLGIVLVYLPNHALIGLQIGKTETDEYIEIDGNNYVLAEPTGPALMPLGSISASSKRAIQANAFTVEHLPIR